jgi:hypothetical protein
MTNQYKHGRDKEKKIAQSLRSKRASDLTARFQRDDGVGQEIPSQCYIF